MSTGRRSSRWRWGLSGLVLLGACVTESLAICINCGGPFRIVDMRGGYQVVLTASAGGAVPCSLLAVNMASSISWNGCLSPQGGVVDSVHEVISLRFTDSSGVVGALSFSMLEGGLDSAQGFWRASCVKLETAGACPTWAGRASWTRDSVPASGQNDGPGL